VHIVYRSAYLRPKMNFYVIIIIIEYLVYPLFALSTTRDHSEPTVGAFNQDTPKIYWQEM
jgi:hypothetical protein